MPVLATDLKILLSANSIGGAATSTELSGNNLVDVFSGQEAADGATVYALVYIENGADQEALNASVHISSETAHAGADVEIGLGTSAFNATEPSIANENTAPAGVTFSDADGEQNALSLGTMPANSTKALWVKIALTAGVAPKDVYGVSLQIDAETAE